MEITVISSNFPEAEPALKGKKRCPSCSYVPSERALGDAATQLLALVLIYGALWGILGKETLPGSQLFALLLLAVSCHIGGTMVQFIKLPPLLGMLLVGFMFRNLPFIPYHKDISMKWASILRNCALVIILLRAGLGLDPAVLRRLSMVCLRLSLTPCLCEAACVGVTSHFLLGLPWVWSFMLGFVLGAVSPAIVVPSMLALTEKKLGVRKGIPTLVIAAASLDDVVAITGFGVTLGIVFSNGSLAWTLIKGPLEVLVGLAYGAVLGVIFWYLPNPLAEQRVIYRVIILTVGGLAVMFVSQALDFSGAGALGCLTLSFIAALKWRHEEDKNKMVYGAEAWMWTIFQTLLFGLIGTEVSIEDLEHGVGYAVLCLLISLTLRIFVTSLITFGAGFNYKEKIFVAFAWLPKATVQAAIGSVALDLARSTDSGPEYIAYGKQVLTVAVLSILLTAPVGSLAISLLAPILLKEKEEGGAETAETTTLKKPTASSDGPCENDGTKEHPQSVIEASV